ncbi:acetyl-CoA C-acetyltransferase [Burkholderiales bacterium]|nr:MAG: acetyl-CoA C-acyltransferase family protein [Burkholderiales bacterium]CAG1010303.1 acetyl-CoA C-acetyltransferase [Burkholderiales bacterium]
MSGNREVVVLSGVRTAIGDFGGSLKDIAANELAAQCVREAVSRAKVDPADVGHFVLGNVIHSEPRDMYISRLACVNGGLPHGTPALTVNRLCGSGLQAIVSASQHVLLGDSDFAAAGGAESMSRATYMLPGGRWGQRMGDGKTLDAMVGALTDPFDGVHMGITAENVAAKYGISRADQDALAVESHRRAAAATEAGYFKEQILPITLQSRKGPIVVDRDEHVRGSATVEDMAKLKPVFQKDGTVTAGNASGINDGAAIVVLAEKGAAAAKGLKPMARLVAYGHAGVDPKYMGIGPVPAVTRALERAGLKIGDMDVIEANEAFAAQALAVARQLGFDLAKTNPNGSGVGLGHPIGATGAILTVKAIYELHRTRGRYALVTMCIGGGQGIAAIFERM